MEQIKNMELGWIEQDGPVGDIQADVVSRIGPQAENVRFLIGGLANRNYAIGSDKVLRVYGRPDCKKSLELEDRLNNAIWRNFSSPKTVIKGEDYLLQNQLKYREFTESRSDGRLAGKVLGEIHGADCRMAQGHNSGLAGIFRSKPLTRRVITIMERVFSSISDKKTHLNKDVFCMRHI